MYIISNIQGARLPLVIFAILTFVFTTRALIHMLKDDGGAQAFATIPLDTYPPGAAKTIIAFQAAVGIDQLLLCFVYILILVRYRSLLPLGYILITLEFGLGTLIIGSGWKPIEFSGTAPGYVAIFVVPPMALVLCWLSLPRGNDKHQ